MKITITEAYKDYAREYAEENNLNVSFTENSIAYSSAVSGGETKIVWNAIYTTVYLSHTDTQRVVTGSEAGAIAAALIPDATLSKVLATVLAAEALIFDKVDQGNGIVMYVAMMLPYTGTVLWVKAQ